MTKRTFYIYIGIFLLFCSCAPTSEPNIDFDSSNAVQNWNGVSINISDEISIEDNLLVTVEVKNTSGFFLHYGLCWQLEQYNIDGSISPCQYQSQPFFSQSLQVLPPDCSTMHTVDLSCYKGTLKAGQYRIVFGPIGASTTDIEHLNDNNHAIEVFSLYKNFKVK